MNIKAATSVAVALSAALASTGAIAVPSASASLNLATLNYAFTDTNASDGIDASLELQFGANFAEVCLVALGDSTCLNNGMGQVKIVPLGDAAFSSDSIPGLAGTASVAAGAGLIESRIVGVSPGGQRSVNAEQYVIVRAHGDSRLSFSLDYSLSVDAGGAPSFQQSQAWLGIVVSPNLDYYGQHFQFDQYMPPLATGSDSRSGVLSGAFDLHDGVTYFIEARVHTDVNLTSAVPEPQGWALMLAGLPGLAALAKRRRAA